MTPIETKYLGPTNTRGARISARFNGHRISVPYPCELSGEAAHFVALTAMLKSLGGNATWIAKARVWVCAESQDGRGYVYTPILPSNKIKIGGRK